MTQREIYKWAERFKERNASITDEIQPCHPSISRIKQHIQRVDALIRKNRRLTLAHVVEIIDNSCVSAQVIIKMARSTIKFVRDGCPNSLQLGINSRI